MEYIVKHDIKGRLRVHFCQNKMTYRQADILDNYLLSNSAIKSIKIYENTCDVVIFYDGSKIEISKLLKKFNYKDFEGKKDIISSSSRELNAVYKGKLINKLLFRGIKYTPAPLFVNYIILGLNAIRYIKKGIQSLLRGKLEVEVLDAIAITVSIIQRNFKTASSIMFLLGIGEILEEWTHKKSVNDLARSISLNVDKVWLLKDDQEILVDYGEIVEGDTVVVRMGNVIPFDGVVLKGESLVNQSSLTGESEPLRKAKDGYVYAGSVIEEGEIYILVKEASGKTKFEEIVKMIEQSEKLKSTVEGKALNLADKLVPLTLIGTGVTYLLTRSMSKSLSILMVDFSCALKLAIPITMLSSMREAGNNGISVKGGMFLEKMAIADTIVFDKTGTLTVSKPKVSKIVTLSSESEDECLTIAACLEEHFPHSVAKAVVKEATRRNLQHDEMHSKVDYILAHGIATHIDGEKVVIGSHHFVIEDEKCVVDPKKQKKFDSISPQYSKLLLSKAGKVIAVICIEDPLRDEAKEVIKSLRELGFLNIVMMTGDSQKTADSIAEKVGITEYFAEVLPEDKANYIESQKQKGHTVIMVGDGINDAPALSASDCGIAISNGAEIARDVSDITIKADNLNELIKLRILSQRLMSKINRNYNYIVSINAILIMLGVTGRILPTSTAILHNASTLGISLLSMKNVLED